MDISTIQHWVTSAEAAFDRAQKAMLTAEDFVREGRSLFLACEELSLAREAMVTANKITNLLSESSHSPYRDVIIAQNWIVFATEAYNLAQKTLSFNTMDSRRRDLYLIDALEELSKARSALKVANLRNSLSTSERSYMYASSHQSWAHPLMSAYSYGHNVTYPNDTERYHNDAGPTLIQMDIHPIVNSHILFRRETKAQIIIMFQKKRVKVRELTAQLQLFEAKNVLCDLCAPL